MCDPPVLWGTKLDAGEISTGKLTILRVNRDDFVQALRRVQPPATFSILRLRCNRC